MTPLEISILLHYLMSPEEYPGAVFSADERALWDSTPGGPAVRSAVERLVRTGLLVDTYAMTHAPTVPPCPPFPCLSPIPSPIPGAPPELPRKPARYRAGEGLAVYVEALSAVPLPVCQWVMPK